MQQRHEGRIESGGGEADVRFADVSIDDPVQQPIDAAYSAKYRGYASSVAGITTDAARATTMSVARI